MGNIRDQRTDDTQAQANAQKASAKQKTKEHQKELTLSILNAYSAIKPTIVQAQRMVKIIESLCEQINVAKYLNYKFVKNFADDDALENSELDRDLVSQLSQNSTFKYLRLLSQDVIQVVKLKGGEDAVSEAEDDESGGSSQNSDSDEEQDNSEEDLRKAEQEKSKKLIADLQEHIASVFRSLVKDLLHKKKDFEIIKLLNKTANESEMYIDVVDSLTSLRAIYLKKLSTGSDEERAHVSLLNELGGKIEAHEGVKKQKQDDLTRLKLDRAKTNAQKNEEINKLKKELEEVKTRESDKTADLKRKSEEKLALNDKNHAQTAAKLEEVSKKGKKELEEKKKQNTETENILKKKKVNAENRLENSIKDYDREMEAYTDELKRLDEEFRAEKKKLDDLEEEYRKIRHAKEVNKKLESEWEIKLQQFEIEENRKRDAAKYIVDMWAGWKEKKKRKKRGGMKAGMKA
jgi:hypothetical protein